MTQSSSYRLRIVPTATGHWFGRLMVRGIEIGRISPHPTPEDVCIAAIKTMNASPDYLLVCNGEKVIDLNAGRPGVSLIYLRAALKTRVDAARHSEGE